MKILSLDIETRPSLAYIWSLWDESVPLARLIEPGEVICFAARFLGERKMHFASVHHDGKQKMIERAHQLLDEADVVMTYNGKRFDLPHLNREVLLAGMSPPSPYQQIDLWLVVKRRFKFLSSKLEHVATQLGLEGKVKNDGFELWKNCMAGDEKAWRQMRRYNIGDVVLLEDVYEIVKPWIPGHPSVPLYDGTSGCPTCGQDTLQKRGFAYTKTSKFQRWHCTNCGAWPRSTKRESGLAVTETVY